MKLILVLIVCIAALLVCYSLAVAAKNAERLSQLWYEMQKKKTKSVDPKENDKIEKSRYTF